MSTQALDAPPGHPSAPARAAGPATASRAAATAMAWCGVLLLAVYVVPLYLPPGPRPSPRLGLEASLWTRLFPHVPGWWVAGRLVALVAGALLLAVAGRDALADAWRGWTAGGPASGAATGAARTGAATYEWAALLLAIALVAASAASASLSHAAQLALLVALALPAAVLWVADARERRRLAPSSGAARASVARADRGYAIAVAALVAGWVVYRVLLARHDPRAADFVDVWKNFTFFRDAASRSSGIVTDAAEVGVSNAYLLLLGLPWVGPGGFEPSFFWVQSVHALWIAATAAGVAGLARRFAGAAAMLPAVAMLLFSPFMLSMAVSAAPFGLATALGAAMLLLVCRVLAAPGRGDVAALGALAGFSATLPHLTFLGIAATMAVLPSLVRRTPSLRVWATAALLGVATVVPVLVGFGGIPEMSAMYLEPRGVVAELEPIIMGQRYLPLREVGALWHQGVRGVLDVPLGTLLQPFAILRSPVRLSGDVYYEPIGAALAAVAIAACALAARRLRPALTLLAALAVALLPGTLGSAFDRASLTRNLVVPVVLPVLTGVGVLVARRALGVRVREAIAATALAAVIAASGVAIFDFVNPRIVAASWLGIALRALGPAPADDVLILEPGEPRWEWLWAPEIAANVPPVPLPTRAYRNPGSLLAGADSAAAAARLVFWSVGLEEEESVRRALCGCWPAATLFEVRDAAGLSRVLAARLDGGWQPDLPAAQWTASSCAAWADGAPSCRSLRALARYNRAHDLAQAGRVDDAVAGYREAIALDPGQVEAHNDLALALAARGEVEAAIAHYRAALARDPSRAAVHNNLAIALESTGRVDEAIAEYAEAVRLVPDEPLGHLNLGAALLGRGRSAEAAARFAEVVRRWPGLPDGHLGLADALAAQGRTRDAIAEYRVALDLRPGWPPAAAALAWALATADDAALCDPAAAVALAEQAARDTGDADAVVLRALAAAQASAGRLAEAASTAERASRTAAAAGQEALAADLAAASSRYRAAAD